MKQYLLLLLFFTLNMGGTIFAQAAGTGELIENEKKFSKLSLDSTTRLSFMSYLAPEAVLFRNGNIVNGQQFWKEKKADSTLLTWFPVYADIAGSRNWGYTTGPWEFKKNRNDSLAQAFGSYVTVWRKENNGEWKVLTDIGISHDKLPVSLFPQPSNQPGYSKEDENISAAVDAFLGAEINFILKLQSDQLKTWKDNLSVEARLYRPGETPFLFPGAILKRVSGDTVKIKYEYINGTIAPSGDMGFVYGNVLIGGEGNTATVKGNYLRIWKREKKHQWKIVIDIITR